MYKTCHLEFKDVSKAVKRHDLKVQFDCENQPFNAVFTRYITWIK